ncbi:MAG TPA: hypothetical protein VGW35_16885 [Methylomirabilota bacterium]|jgi:hypothetical protein|nr:hypothetical protein [Methylomirabilota bacterium]
MRASRLIGIGLVVAAAGAGTTLPASADTVILRNGDLVSGELEVTEIQVATQGGPVRAEPRDVAGVTFGMLSGGDHVKFRTGSGVTGLVDQPAYTLRLPSGQTLVIGRAQVLQLFFAPR